MKVNNLPLETFGQKPQPRRRPRAPAPNASNGDPVPQTNISQLPNQPVLPPSSPMDDGSSSEDSDDMDVAVFDPIPVVRGHGRTDVVNQNVPNDIALPADLVTDTVLNETENSEDVNPVADETVHDADDEDYVTADETVHVPDDETVHVAADGTVPDTDETVPALDETDVIDGATDPVPLDTTISVSYTHLTLPTKA